MYRDAVLVRYSEIAVKGRYTRPRLEKMLAGNVREALERRNIPGTVERMQGRIVIWDPGDPRAAAEAAAHVFGVKSTSPAKAYKFRGLGDLVEAAASFFAERARGRRFRVTARRAGSHDFTSLDVERLLGARLLEEGAGPVDLVEPEYTAYLEVRGDTVFLYDEVLEGPGGLPLGSEEPSLVLFSGGFDSTAAAWLVMRRGSPAGLAYFDMGVAEARETALEVARLLAREWVYGRPLRVYIVDFRDVAGLVARRVKPKYRVLVVRRLMMEEAERLALARGYEALVTGESIGQVATQTVRNIRLIGSGLRLPVLRPVSGMDKDEVVGLVRRIGLYEPVSRQVEACRQGVDPTPRGDPRVFEEELGKVAGKYTPPRVEEIVLGG